MIAWTKILNNNIIKLHCNIKLTDIVLPVRHVLFFNRHEAESKAEVIGVNTFSTDEALQLLLKHFIDDPKTLQYSNFDSAVSNPQYYGG